MRPPQPLPIGLLELAASQENLLSSAQCLAHGVTAERSATLVRLGIWTRVTRGVYDVEPKPPSPRSPDAVRRRSVWTALLAYGPESIAVGKGALALHGILGLPLTIPIEAAVPRGMEHRNRGDLRLRQFDNGLETVEIAGRRVANIQWALAQAVPELSRGNAVAVMDSALNLGLIDARGLARAHDLARGRLGVARTHDWWCLADGRAESPLETAGRLDCLDLGIPPDDLQVVIQDRNGRFLGRGDMGWKIDDDRWLIAEMDGREFHESAAALLYDRRRQNDLVQVADVLRFASEDARLGVVASTVRRHLRVAHTRRTRG